MIVATCIIVLKKSKATSDILFVDASNEFKRYDTRNHVEPENIERIVGAIAAREDVEHFCKTVPNDDVVANDANLSVSSYVEKEDTREEIDIVALNAEISRIVAREQELREAIDAIVADLEGGAR